MTRSRPTASRPAGTSRIAPVQTTYKPSVVLSISLRSIPFVSIYLPMDFTIVTASYNYGHYIGECLQSVEAQEGVTLQHLGKR